MTLQTFGEEFLGALLAIAFVAAGMYVGLRGYQVHQQRQAQLAPPQGA